VDDYQENWPLRDEPCSLVEQFHGCWLPGVVGLGSADAIVGAVFYHGPVLAVSWLQTKPTEAP
jgi:hypothetical protein